MTDDEVAIYRMALERRVTRLGKLIALKAPPYIIAHEVILVMKAAVGFCGDAFGTAWQHFMLQSVRQGMGLCVSCGSPGADAWGLCPQCVAGVEAEEREDERLS